MGEVEHAIARQDNGLLDHVLEFPDVSRPVIEPKGFQCARRDAIDRPAHLTANSIAEVTQKHRQILEPLPQRGQRDREDIEAIVQILSELAAVHFFDQIPVGGSHDPDVDVHRPRAAEPFELAFLQDAKQLGL